MRIHPFIAVALITAAVPARAANTVVVSPQMWDRVQAVESVGVDLKPTPSPQAPVKVSLSECLTLAFRHNAGFRSNLRQLLDARQSLWVAEQRLSYTLTGSAERDKEPGGVTQDSLVATTTARWEALNGGALSASLGTGAQDTFGLLLNQRPAVSASYDQPLLRGFGLASSTAERVRRARTALASQEMSFFDAYQDLAQQVIGDYFAVLLARGEVEIAQRSVDRAQKLYDINYAKFTGEGLKKPGETWVTQVAEIDVDQARLSWEQAKQQLISRQQGARDAVDALLLDMGFVPGATPELTTSIAYSPQEYAEASLIKTALDNSTQIGRLALSQQDAAAALRIARSERRPDITASVGVNDLGETVGGATTSTGWFTGVRVDVPLLDRQRTANADRSERALQVLDQQLVATRDQVTQEVQQQVRAAASSRARIDIGEQAVALARKNREAAQGMYDEGLSDYLRVLDADDRLVQAERALLQEQVQYLLTTVRVRRAVGEDVTKELPK